MTAISPDEVFERACMMLDNRIPGPETQGLRGFQEMTKGPAEVMLDEI